MTCDCKLQTQLNKYHSFEPELINKVYNIMYFAQCSLKLNKINKEIFGIWVNSNESVSISP